MANSKPVGIAYSDPDLSTGWAINGTAVTATAAQVNNVAAVTSTAAVMQQIFDSYGTVTFNRSIKIARVALSAAGTGVFSWANPEAGDILISRVELDVTTVTSVGGATIDVGVTTVSSSTTSDNLIDGKDINAATGVFDNITDVGTNGKSRQRIATGKWVTGTASGTPTALVGFVYIHYHSV